MANKPRYNKGQFLRAIRGDAEAHFVPRKIKLSDNVSIDDPFCDNPTKSSYGHIPTIAKRLGCSYQTVCNYLNRQTKMADELRRAVAEEIKRGEKERADFQHEIVNDAEKGLHLLVREFDLSAIKFALERLDKVNYSLRSELTGADGQALFDAETTKMLNEMGIDIGEAMKAAAQMIKAKLAEAQSDSFSMESGDE